MKKTLKSIITGLALAASATLAPAQGTAFTYQGRLTSSGNAANGIYDFRFRLATDALGNNGYSATVFTNGIGVTNGLFTTTIDFGAGYFTGDKYWLEVDVRTNGSANYTALTPLQAFTPTPYAMFADTAGTALTAGALSPSASTNYVLKTGDTMGGSLTVGGNLRVNGSQIALGNGASVGSTGSTASGHSWAMADYSTGLGYGSANGPYSLAAGTSVTIGTASVALGDQNVTWGDYSFAVGQNNVIDLNAPKAAILGGDWNEVLGWATGSIAAGHRAQAAHPGSFIWADSTEADYATTGNNQFCIRAAGGVQLSANTSVFFGSQIRQMLNLYNSDYGIGVQNSDEYFRTAQEFMWFRGGSHTNTFMDPGAGGAVMMRLGSGGLYVNGTFVNSSDRNAKEHFKNIQARDILDKVAALPITQWNYKEDNNSWHIGPMAQDFFAAFGVGPDDKHITTIDESGVALAAIQGLNQKLEAACAELKRRDIENAELKARLDRLEQLLDAKNQ